MPSPQSIPLIAAFATASYLLYPLATQYAIFLFMVTVPTFRNSSVLTQMFFNETKRNVDHYFYVMLPKRGERAIGIAGNWIISFLFSLSACHALMLLYSGETVPMSVWFVISTTFFYLTCVYLLAEYEITTQQSRRPSLPNMNSIKDTVQVTSTLLGRYNWRLHLLWTLLTVAPLASLIFIQYTGIIGFWTLVCGATLFVIILLFKVEKRSSTKARVPLDQPTDADVKWNDIVNKSCPATNDSYLIVGCGFLGCRMIKALLLRGEKKIKVFDLGKPPMFIKCFEGNEHVQFIKGDVTNVESLVAACQGVDTVYHMAVIIKFYERLPHQYGVSHKVNVQGSLNVIQACQEAGVRRLIFTSSSSVSVGYGLSKFNMNEESPFVDANTCVNHYGLTKALAETAILRANGSKTTKGLLYTGSIRPCSGIFGYKDSLQVELIVGDKAKPKILPMVSPQMIMDYVFVDNVVLGHLLLEAQMRRENPEALGKAFCINNNEPMSSDDFYRTIRHFLPGVTLLYIPVRPIRLLGYLVEWIENIFPGTASKLNRLQILTPASLAFTHMSYTFTSEKAQKILGYKPAYTVDQGIMRCIREFKQDTMMVGDIQ